jgi:type II secretory pathway pseudopilin PulG
LVTDGPAARPAGGSRGFTFMEILVGICVLALAFVSLSAYTSSQRKGLNVSSQLADGTQVAATALETMKGQLSDSTAFRNLYDQVQSGSRVISDHKTVNNLPYSVALTVTRAPSPLYALKVRAKVTWKSTHKVELGMMFPGAAGVL